MRKPGKRRHQETQHLYRSPGVREGSRWDTSGPSKRARVWINWSFCTESYICRNSETCYWHSTRPGDTSSSRSHSCCVGWCPQPLHLHLNVYGSYTKYFCFCFIIALCYSTESFVVVRFAFFLFFQKRTAGFNLRLHMLFILCLNLFTR